MTRPPARTNPDLTAAMLGASGSPGALSGGGLAAYLRARIVIQPNGCWLWQGTLNPGGYGRAEFQGKRGPAHRAVYELLVGPVDEGMELDHVRANGCTNRHCVKAIADEYGPAHLEPVTHRENVGRSANHVAVNAAKTHCDRGHPFDLLNTYFPPGGARRQCRICLRAADQRRRTRERQRRAA